ncbi:MAG: hypothetical protein LBQ77_01375 [Treponema sp.]|nr:hypothetical protein [Treponema sp.]
MDSDIASNRIQGRNRIKFRDGIESHSRTESNHILIRNQFGFWCGIEFWYFEEIM